MQFLVDVDMSMWEVKRYRSEVKDSQYPFDHRCQDPSQSIHRPSLFTCKKEGEISENENCSFCCKGNKDWWKLEGYGGLNRERKDTKLDRPDRQTRRSITTDYSASSAIKPSTSFSDNNDSPMAPRWINNLWWIGLRPPAPLKVRPTVHSSPMWEPQYIWTETSPVSVLEIRHTRTDPSSEPVTNSIGTTGFQATFVTAPKHPLPIATQVQLSTSPDQSWNVLSLLPETIHLPQGE